MWKSSQFAYTLGLDVTPQQKFISDYLQSLNPLPKQVELEIKTQFKDGRTGEWYDGIAMTELREVPVVDEKGFVKVKRWIYD